MENRSPYIIVGAAVLLFLFGIVGFLIWKLGAGDRTNYAYYNIFFGGEVLGLAQDSPVYYRGIKVGRVHSFGLASRREKRRLDGRERDVEKIRVTVAIDRKIDIRVRSYAVFERSFITNAAYIQVVGRLEADEVMPKKGLGEMPYPEIRVESSFLSAAQLSVQELMTKLGTTVDQLNVLLSSDNINAVSQTLANLQKATDAFGKQHEAIEETLKELPGMVGSLHTTSDEVKAGIADLRKAVAGFDQVAANVNLLLADIGPQDEAARKALAGRTPSEIRQTLLNIQKSAARLEAASDGFAALAAENRKPIRQFTDTGLQELAQTIRELRSLTANLNVIATKLERDPMNYVFGGKQGYTPK